MGYQWKFSSKLWIWSGEGAWVFAGVPEKDTEVIRDMFGDQSRGFGSLPVQVRLGSTEWRTSIFYDSKRRQYLLPIKKDVRKKEDVSPGDVVEINLVIVGV